MYISTYIWVYVYIMVFLDISMFVLYFTVVPFMQIFEMKGSAFANTLRTHHTVSITLSRDDTHEHILHKTRIGKHFPALHERGQD
jgi:hypothetical protein